MLKEAPGHQESHQKIQCWLTNYFKIEKLESSSRNIFLYDFLKSFVFFTVFGFKRGLGKWHLPIKSLMFLESVNKNKPGNLCFKEIQKTWGFLTNPTRTPLQHPLVKICLPLHRVLAHHRQGYSHS